MAAVDPIEVQINITVNISREDEDVKPDALLQAAETLVGVPVYAWSADGEDRIPIGLVKNVNCDDHALHAMLEITDTRLRPFFCVSDSKPLRDRWSA